MRPSRVVILLIALATLAAALPWRAVGRARRRELLFVVWGMPFEDALFRDVYARGFERLHPGVRVVYQRHGPEIAQKYQAWHLTGRGADVMRLPITDYHALIDKGIIEPLDRFIDDPIVGLSAEQQADFFPTIWRQLEIEGQRYALPEDSAQYGLYYNKAVFDHYNAAHTDAPLSYPNADWTWDDLRDATRKLTIRDERGRVVQYGIDFALWGWPFITLLHQAGGRIWDDGQTTTLIDSPEGVEALESIVELLADSPAVRSQKSMDAATGPDKLFALGHTAMLLDGSWRAPDLENTNPSLDFAIAPLPRGKVAASVSGSVLWCMSVHAPDKALAWEMLKYLTAREQALAYWQRLRVAPPASLSVVRSEEFRATTGVTMLVGGEETVLVPPMPRERFEDWAAWLLHPITPDPATGEVPGFIPVAPYQADFEREITNALAEAVRGDKTPAAALRDAADAVHAIIDRDRKAKGLRVVER